MNAGALDKNGQFVTFAIYAPQNVTKLETGFKEEVARVLKDGFTAEEVAAAKSGYLQFQKLTRAQDSAISGKLASYLFLNRTFKWDEELDNKIAALTAEQINAAMKRYLDLSKMTIIKAGDFTKAAAASGK